MSSISGHQFTGIFHDSDTVSMMMCTSSGMTQDMLAMTRSLLGKEIESKFNHYWGGNWPATLWLSILAFTFVIFLLAFLFK